MPMSSEVLKLHNYEDYHRSEIRRETSRCVRKLGSAALACLMWLGVYDMGNTMINVPDKAPVVVSYDNDIPGYREQAAFDILYLDPTGKSVVHNLAELNKPLAREHNAATIVLVNGTREDIPEMSVEVNRLRARCLPFDSEPVKLLIIGQSVGGKVGQKIDNNDSVQGVVAIVQEATPSGPFDINDLLDRALVWLAGNVELPVGKGMIEVATFGGSFRRNVNPLDPVEQENNRKSAEETNPKVLAWQAVTNAQPYPIAIDGNDNNSPIYYIYSEADEVVNTKQALRSIRSAVRAPVYAIEIGPDKTDPTGLNHAEGWLVDRYHEAYREKYRLIFSLVAESMARPELIQRDRNIKETYQLIA